ncbi:MAG: tRNA pseudouridine(38-40) synthase TruA [Bacteroidales bacterium]|jgi:tRNA pseudouridine38-40 synthase|nr:tRNA pseudouridine(38-40) synthase TruA [Bacteroidales bacterium]
MRYFICLSYNGSAFCGWQIQENANSVQAELQNALSTLLKTPIQVVGAGRTDTGVNARNYIAHFDVEHPVSCDRTTIYKLNAILPKAISIHKIWPVSDDMHARFSAKSRTYKYYIHTAKDPFCSEFSYFLPPRLNFEKMNEAAAHFLGEQDFTSLEKLGGGNKTSICNVTHARWEPLDAPTFEEATHFVFTVSANRFLRNMVRAMVGSLLDVGFGKREPEWIPQMLQSKNRGAAGHSVPGNALFLVEVEY